MKLCPFFAARALALAGAAWLLVGCSDNRISLEEYQRLEQESRKVEPVLVPANDLGLTDLHPVKIRPGDTLALTFYGHQTEPYTPTVLTLRVYDDGTINLPVVGPVAVADMDLAGVEKAIIDAHVPQYYRNMAVFAQLSQPSTVTVVVLGAAGTRGVIRLEGNQRNALYAMAAAGGFAAGSSGRVRIKSIRPERDELVFNINDMNDLRRALTAPPLESGDMLVVEGEPSPTIYMNGLLNRPGPLLIPAESTLSLVRAIAASGGLRDNLYPKEGTLWRKLPDGRQVRVKIDIEKIMAGKAPDLALAAGDVLDIPHTAETMFNEWFNRNILIGPFSMGVHYDPLGQYNTDRALRLDDGGGFGGAVRETLRFGVPNILYPPVPVPP